MRATTDDEREEAVHAACLTLDLEVVAKGAGPEDETGAGRAAGEEEEQTERRPRGA